MNMPKMKDMPYIFGLKLRFWPSGQQKVMVEKNAEAARFVYNRLVSMSRELHDKKKTAPYVPLDRARVQELEELLFPGKGLKVETEFKVLAPFVQEKYVDSDAVMHAVMNYQTAWKNFRERPSCGIPCYKRKRAEISYQTSCHYTKSSKDGNDGSVHFTDKDHLFLPKLKRVRVKGSKKFVDFLFGHLSEARIGTVTISRDAQGRYFATLQVGCLVSPWEEWKKTGKDGAFDLNLRNFLTEDDGTVTDNPHFLKKTEKKLKKAQRRLSRRYESAKRSGKKRKECKNYQKQKRKLAVLHEKTAAQRLEFQNVLSRHLLEKHDTEYAEDLKTKNLLHNHHLAKAISDVSWSQFLLLCSRKAEEHGKKFVKVPPQYTTQTCSSCGHVCSDEDHLGLHVEEWTCPVCGTHHVRDHNAAENILARGRMLQGKEEKKAA